jgi:hypothetical protein
MGSKGLSKTKLTTPALEESQAGLDRSQSAERRYPMSLEPFNESGSRRREQLSEPDEFAIPWCGLHPGLQCCIPLFESPHVSLPVAHEIWFHVEHCPVQPATPLRWTFLDEAMDTRIDHLNRQDLGELNPRIGWGAIDPNRKAAVARKLDPKAVAGLRIRAAMNPEARRLVPDQLRCMTRAEGSAAA